MLSNENGSNESPGKSENNDSNLNDAASPPEEILVQEVHDDSSHEKNEESLEAATKKERPLGKRVKTNVQALKAIRNCKNWREFEKLVHSIAKFRTVVLLLVLIIDAILLGVHWDKWEQIREHVLIVTIVSFCAGIFAIISIAILTKWVTVATMVVFTTAMAVHAVASLLQFAMIIGMGADGRDAFILVLLLLFSSIYVIFVVTGATMLSKATELKRLQLRNRKSAAKDVFV